MILLLGSYWSSHAAEPLDFNRDIRPILSAKCFSCHGPDDHDRDADLRLDTEEGAYTMIVPGKPEDSELVYRITCDDDTEIMPPPKAKNPLSKKEIELLQRWVKEGAPYAGHWAFEPVKRPNIPKVKSATTHAIDHFIARRLEKLGYEFSPEAKPETLVRRLYLDLTGLPPATKELDAYLHAPDSNYEKTVDQLLESSHFAERLALEWLDVARFADTNGYSIDDHRDMWAWRDWVIHAFQNNLPYDQFIKQQVAGDLIPEATDLQQMATGFLRNSMNTHEGGTIAEEYRVAYIADKIDTVSTAFMGMTMKCAQCHDHKYDPISMKDYYRFFAFFNTSSEGGRGAVNGNTKPFIQVAPILQDDVEFRRVTEERIATLEHLIANPEPILGHAKAKWEKAELAKIGDSKTSSTAGGFPIPKKGQVKQLFWIWSDPQGGGSPNALFRKTFNLEEIPHQASILVSCDNEARVFINGHFLGKNPDWREPTVFDLQPYLSKGENLIAIQGKEWDASGKFKAALFALISLSDGTYIGTDGSWLASGRKPKTGWQRRGGNTEGFEPASVVAKHGVGPWGSIFSRIKAGTKQFYTALRKPQHQRSKQDEIAIAEAFAKANPDMKKLLASIKGEIAIQQKALKEGKTTVMVMDSKQTQRKTPVLIRGAYDQHGDVVTAGIPVVFGDLPESDTADRLALANWLIDAENPLTARVTVNRYWQMLFGTGLVKTAEDFGSQGEWPSHPELLDWLAVEFMESGWDVRALLKSMLLSRTYKQASEVSKLLLETDPYNRLLGRAPRYRLPAELLRDNALEIAGLIDRKVGGPSVYPPQPNGLWKEVSHFGHPTFFTSQHFYPDRGKPVYRRSMYTFWKRTAPPPVMATFDAPNRETCAVRRSLTNTPLQALALMNEPQFVEASQGLARRMLAAGEEFDEQLKYGFRLATARYPSTEEAAIFRQAFERQQAYFLEEPERAVAYVGKEDAKLAAMSSVASLILNLDETITRE